MKNCKLKLSEWKSILRWVKLPGYSLRRIARELGRHHTTISRAVKRAKRDSDMHAASSERAEQAYEAQHQRRVQSSSSKMRLKTNAIRHYVELHLREAHWSPETIAGKLTLMRQPISAEAIYQWINEEKPELKSCLLIAGKSKRRRQVGKKHRKPKKIPSAPKVSIELLPGAAKERTEIGHLELDAMHGKKSTSVIQNKTDRKSRKMWLDKVNSLEAKTYAETLIKRVKSDIPIVKTFLEDNGSEHAEYAQIDKTLKTQTYFCHPYCASERGTVENRNKALRRFLPKGEDFSDIPDEFIEWIEDYFNNMPMKILGFKTPNQVWNEGLKKAA